MNTEPKNELGQPIPLPAISASLQKAAATAGPHNILQGAPVLRLANLGLKLADHVSGPDLDRLREVDRREQVLMATYDRNSSGVIRDKFAAERAAWGLEIESGDVKCPPPEPPLSVRLEAAKAVRRDIEGVLRELNASCDPVVREAFKQIHAKLAAALAIRLSGEAEEHERLGLEQHFRPSAICYALAATANRCVGLGVAAGPGSVTTVGQIFASLGMPIDGTTPDAEPETAARSPLQLCGDKRLEDLAAILAGLERGSGDWRDFLDGHSAELADIIFAGFKITPGDAGQADGIYAAAEALAALAQAEAAGKRVTTGPTKEWPTYRLEPTWQRLAAHAEAIRAGCLAEFEKLSNWIRPEFFRHWAVVLSSVGKLPAALTAPKAA